ncbi:thiosulfate oxidation carrier complex protein SoxZ [Algicella marina]|uniref:Thiosulfate oxidation carrier complex protein SoxZ n=1 Tax=Algicella marina TaxID=2683284 RepID=A0A6P1T5A9_9RHOB|nr:thiosulfate oxidation carrier complex protein SoxZ [Algicella marina]QHQ36910.1 thiosulfate oxidation carrier complex protein SoxZ [Algicella marina]
MASGVKTRIKLPAKVKAGRSFTIKTMVTHPMESGQRRNAEGGLIPRSIINRFSCTFEGETVVDVEMHPSVSSNPFLEFEAVIPTSGVLQFTWFDDDGDIYREEKQVDVT